MSGLPFKDFLVDLHRQCPFCQWMLVSGCQQVYPNEELKVVSYGSAAAIWHSLGNVKRADHSALPISQPFGAMPDIWRTSPNHRGRTPRNHGAWMTARASMSHSGSDWHRPDCAVSCHSAAPITTAWFDLGKVDASQGWPPSADG